MLIALVNASTLVTDAELETIAAAIQIQFTLDISPAWGMVPPTVSFYTDKANVPSWAWTLNVIDSDDAVQGALGYHDQSATGSVESFVMAAPILSNGGAVMIYDASNPAQYYVSATVSHECAEMYLDRYCGNFVLGPQIASGNMYCMEMADAVEDGSYFHTIHGEQIAVSNFLFPAFFNMMATANNKPFDRMGLLEKQFTMTKGGYQIVATLSNEGQITARTIYGDSMPQWRRDCKEKEFSRAGRRITR